jgi:hypothetical protein
MRHYSLNNVSEFACLTYFKILQPSLKLILLSGANNCGKKTMTTEKKSGKHQYMHSLSYIKFIPQKMDNILAILHKLFIFFIFVHIPTFSSVFLFKLPFFLSFSFHPTLFPFIFHLSSFLHLFPHFRNHTWQYAATFRYTCWFQVLAQYLKRMLWRLFGANSENKIFLVSLQLPVSTIFLRWCRCYCCYFKLSQNGNNLF